MRASESESSSSRESRSKDFLGDRFSKIWRYFERTPRFVQSIRRDLSRLTSKIKLAERTTPGCNEHLPVLTFMYLWKAFHRWFRLLPQPASSLNLPKPNSQLSQIGFSFQNQTQLSRLTTQLFVRAAFSRPSSSSKTQLNSVSLCSCDIRVSV
jgi:hypothetical protein